MDSNDIISVDRKVLAEQSEYAGEAVYPILSRFYEGLPDRVERLIEACTRRDREEVIRLAHQLKGSAAGFGALRIASLAAGILEEARAGRLADDEGGILPLREAALAAKAEFPAILESLRARAAV